MRTTLILPCLLDDCQELVHVEYEPGEPQTYWESGIPDFWYPHKHGRDSSVMTVSDPAPGDEHLSRLWNNPAFQSRCDRVANSSWDNIEEW